MADPVDFTDVFQLLHFKTTEANNKVQQALAREQELRDELAGLRAFLNTNNSSDSHEVAAGLDDVNDLLNDLASSVSIHYIPSPEARYSKDGTLPQRLYEEMRKTDRPSLCLLKAMLACDPNDGNNTPVILQFAIKNSVLHQTITLMNRFCCGLDDATNKNLQALAEAVQLRELQPVYGRWRSVTHEGVRNSLVVSEHKEYLLREAVKITSAHILEDVFLTFGYRPNQELYDGFHNSFGNDLREIFDHAVKLSAHLKEKMITKDYLPFTALSRPFDPDYMELAHKTPALPPGDNVVACLRLGLFTRSKVGRSDTKLQNAIWKKPQVVTQSMISEFLPSSSTAGTASSSQSSTPSPSRLPYLRGVSARLRSWLYAAVVNVVARVTSPRREVGQTRLISGATGTMERSSSTQEGEEVSTHKPNAPKLAGDARSESSLNIEI